MTQVEVKINDWVTEGFNLYKENFGTLVLVSLIAVLLSGVTLGILAGPLMGGFLMITLALYDKKEPKPQVGDIFKGFGFFVNTFLFVLVWGLGLTIVSLVLNIIPLLGQLASLALGLCASAFLMFGMFLIVDKGMDFWPASMESINVVKSNFGPFLGLGVLAAIIGYIGAMLCGIGYIFTAPIQACILTVAYREVFGGGVRDDEAEEDAEAAPYHDTTPEPEAEPVTEDAPAGDDGDSD